MDLKYSVEKLWLVIAYFGTCFLFVGLEFSLISIFLFTLGLLTKTRNSFLSTSQRASLLFASFVIPSLVAWVVMTVVWVVMSYVFHVRSVFVPWNVGAVYIAGCFGLLAMVISLVAGRYWWLLGSFFFPCLAVDGFFATCHFFKEAGRAAADSLTSWSQWDDLRLFCDSVQLVLWRDISNPGEYSSSGKLWGLSGFLLAATCLGLVKFFRAYHFARIKVVSPELPNNSDFHAVTSSSYSQNVDADKSLASTEFADLSVESVPRQQNEMGETDCKPSD